MRLGCSPTQAHDLYGAGTGSLTAEQAAELAAEMGDEARQVAREAAQAVADAEQGAEPLAREAGRGAVTQEQGWIVTTNAERAAEEAYEEWRLAREAALAEQCALDALFLPLEYSVLNWPTQLTGAEPEFWACWIRNQ